MDVSQPSESLFALLDFLGIRQRDIAAHLGVGKALVSRWRGGDKAMPAKHHRALLAWAHETFMRDWHAWEQAHATQVLTEAEKDAALRRFQTFVDLHDAAFAERDPQVWYDRVLQDAARVLHELRTQEGYVIHEMETAKRIEDLGRRITAAARLLQTQLRARAQAREQEAERQRTGQM
jgi:transcriptional regulator with XRE-family HTH domain